jgi:cytoskeletal protein CcmA (bactofilin family)
VVSGTNATWDAKKINFVGIKTKDVDIDNSKVTVSVLTTYSASDMKVGGFLVADTAGGPPVTTNYDIVMNKSSLTVVSGGYGVDADEITLKNESGMAVSGNAWGLSSDNGLGALDVKGSSTAIIGNGAELKKLDVSQNSTVTVDGLIILAGAANKVTNNGVINLTGTSAIGLDATFENDYELNVDGTLNVFGKLINKEGTMTNNGTITVFAKKIASTGLSFDMTPDTITSTGNVAQIDNITIDTAVPQIDGSLNIVEATVTFADKAKVAINPSTGYGTYTGTLTTTQSTEKIGYTLNLTSTSDAPMKSSIVISYDASADADKQYTISLSGKIKGTVAAVESEYTLSKPTTPVVAHDYIGDKITTIDDTASNPKVAKAFITAEGGKIVNNSIVNYYGTVGTTVLAKGAGYEGNLNTGIQEITIGGKLKGDVTAGGKVVLTKDGNVEGMIAALGGVDSAGTIKGNIYAESAVKVKNLEGDVNIIRDADEDDLTLTVNGKVSGNVKYVTEYFATKGAETKTVYTASLTLDADLSATATKTMIIDMLPGKSATETTAVVPGYFAFGTTLDEPATGKNVNITITEGKFAFPADKPIPVRYAMTYEAGTIVEVAAVATADFSNAALKVSKDATSNFVTGTSPVTDYGVVKCIMSFSVEDGAYTIYSDVAYAVANCEEGSTLVVEAKEAPINNTILIPKDVKVVVGNGSTMSFGANGLYMSEGAQITLVGTAKVTFTETGKEATTEIVYTVNGTFEYDGNFLNFDGVRFSAASEVSGVAATTTEASKIKVDLTYKDGKATIAGGYGTGSIALQNGTEPKYKDAEPTVVYGTFVVGAEAVFDAVSITDSYASVKYKKVDDVWTISETLLQPTVVGVEGTLNLKNTTEVKGLYAGFGKVTLAEGKSLKLLKGDAYKENEAKDAPGSLNLYVVDTTEESNGYLFNFVSPKVGEEDIILTATKKTLEGEKLDVMTIKGGVRVGAINATTEAVLDDFDVGDEAVIYGDVVFVIADSEAAGYVGAKTIYMDKTGYGKLDYEATFVEDDYTIYTKFAAIDWEEITDVSIEKGVINVEKKLDLSGNDVNIVIGKDAIFNLKAVMIIGTPTTTIGDEGSSIVGKVVIFGDNYLVAYSDVDLTEAEIVGENAKDAAFSKLDVENVPYAAIFAQDYAGTIKLSKADATIIPEIVGYNFTAWINYNGDAGATVGETNAYADSAAVLVTVLVKYVAGVDYYMNGALFNVYDIPTDVPFGSYFSAKISDTTKYQGNPLINGEKTVCVIDDMELVASGVTPIPEPEPEPVVGDSGLSLTDILLIVLVILIAIMVVILVLRLNRS